MLRTSIEEDPQRSFSFLQLTPHSLCPCPCPTEGGQEAEGDVGGPVLTVWNSPPPWLEGPSPRSNSSGTEGQRAAYPPGRGWPNFLQSARAVGDPGGSFQQLSGCGHGVGRGRTAMPSSTGDNGDVNQGSFHLDPTCS